MEIDHILDGTQVDYGYFWWSKKDNDRYKKVFPEGEFTIDLEGTHIGGKRVDWSMGRVSIGKKPMQEIFNKGDKVRISRQPNGVVVVRKTGGHPVRPPIPQTHSISDKLRETQRNSDNPSGFEKAVSEAFSFLGFTTKHIGGKDEPDVFLEDVKAIIDSKTTKEGGISERYINFEAMERYRNNYSASFLAVIAPGFSEGNIRDTSAKKGITLIETEALCKLVENHAQYPYELGLISAVLFESGKTVISAIDIPSSLKSEDTLIELAAKTIMVLKVSGRQSISISELRTFYELQGLVYAADEIERALSFLSTPPLSLFQKDGDAFKLIVPLNMILKKIGLLVEVYSRLLKTT